MRLRQLFIESTVTDLKKYRAKKQMDGVVSDVENAFVKQSELEKEARSAVKKLTANSRMWDSRFKFPGIMGKYMDSVPPMIGLLLDTPLYFNNPSDKDDEFALSKTLEHADLIIEILEEDIQKLKELKKHFKEQNPPYGQDVYRPMDLAIHEYRSYADDVKRLVMKSRK